MGIADQFKDKSRELADKAQKARNAQQANGGKDEASERAPRDEDRMQDERARAQQRAQDARDRFADDYDA
ncbi:hypothetical protein ACFUN8_14035 [Streptomyces sp. NPDC057307]|uniref:hypothetical protein n=1 Tax=Streptomyces sp. NPDC057307 TaxID=3346096 RepID=UPI0036289126